MKNGRNPLKVSAVSLLMLCQHIYQLGWVATDMKIGYIHYQAAEDGGISADYHLMLNQDSNEIAMAYEGHLQMHEHRLITMES